MVAIFPHDTKEQTTNKNDGLSARYSRRDHQHESQSVPVYDWEKLKLGKILGQGTFGLVAECNILFNETRNNNNTKTKRRLWLQKQPKIQEDPLSAPLAIKFLHPISNQQVDVVTQAHRRQITVNKLSPGTPTRRKGKRTRKSRVLPTGAPQEDGGVQGNRSVFVVAKPSQQYMIQDGGTSKSIMLYEAEILQRLHHPNVIALHGVSPPLLSSGPAFIILDQLSQKTLFDYVRQEEWKRDEAKQVSVALQIARALDYLHNEKGVVHRDLKPANIGFDVVTGRAKLFDFGLATRTSAVAHRHALLQTQGQSCGTSPYMAPEVARGQLNQDASIDVYSYALVLWEMFSTMDNNNGPFGTMTSLEWIRLVVKSKKMVRPPLDSIRHYRNLLTICWHDEPGLRPTWNAIIQTLQQTHHRRSSVPTMVHEPLQGERRKRNKSVARYPSPPQGFLC